MPKPTEKPKIKPEVLGKSPKTAICSNSLEITPNIQANSKQSNKQQIPRISAKTPEIEVSKTGESAKSPEFKAEFPGETSQALNSSVFQPKAPQLQTFPKKAQISSVSGISPRERHRYRVTIGDAVLGDFLTLDEALKLANQSTHL